MVDSEHGERAGELVDRLRRDPRFAGPGVQLAVAAARGRRRRRAVVVATALVAIVAGVGIALRPADRPDRLRPANPPVGSHAPSPSPSPLSSGQSSRPSAESPKSTTEMPTSLRDLNWDTATLKLPSWGPSTCVALQLRFVDGRASIENPRWNGTMRYEMLPYGPPTYGDLTGDGVDDAVVNVRCSGVGPPTEKDDHWSALIGYTQNPDGSPRLMWLISDLGTATFAPDCSISDGVLTIGSPGTSVTQRWRWNGRSFEGA